MARGNRTSGISTQGAIIMTCVQCNQYRVVEFGLCFLCLTDPRNQEWIRLEKEEKEKS